MEATKEILEIVKPLIEKGTIGAIKAADIIKEQAPELCGELLRYNFCASLIAFSIWIMFLLLCLVASLVIYKLTKGTSLHDEWYYTAPLIPFFVGLVLGITIICVEGLDFIRIWLAPKLYLVEYIAKIVK